MNTVNKFGVGNGNTGMSEMSGMQMASFDGDT
mgnify:CR=1 FL=1